MSFWGANRRACQVASAQRLRVPRGSGADPLNLIQVMLAKGTFSPALPGSFESNNYI
jgi:hypothetical protein